MNRRFLGYCILFIILVYVQQLIIFWALGIFSEDERLTHTHLFIIYGIVTVIGTYASFATTVYEYRALSPGVEDD